MFPFLKLYSAYHHVLTPVSKILPVLKDAKLFLLRFSSSIKRHNTEHKNQDKVILYQNNDNQYFNKIKLLTIGNFIIWTLFGRNVYISLSTEPRIMDDEIRQKWKENEGNRELTKKLIIASTVLGFTFVLAIWFYLLRSVKQIQLIKSSKMVEIQTHSFFPSVREFSVPLRDISGVINRHAAKKRIPIKIRNSLFHFVIDVKGDFPDTFLFDNSIGVKRDFTDSKYD